MGNLKHALAVVMSSILTSVAPFTALAGVGTCTAIFVKGDRIQSMSQAASSELLENFDFLFRATSGFNSYAEFEKILRAQSDRETVKAIELLDQNQIEVAIRAPEHVRDQVRQTGLRNTHETGTFAGRENEDIAEIRNFIESNMFGFDFEAYSKMPPAVKPKYGAVLPKSESGLRVNSEDLAGYGTDSYHLKTDTILSLLSFTVDDSAGGVLFKKVPKTKDEWYQSLSAGRKWFHSAIPWTRRLLMVPFLIKSLQHGNLFHAANFDGFYTFSLAGYKTEFNSSYVEAQIFGKVDLTSVAAFEFRNTPPSGAFLKALLNHNIKILDGRREPSVEWLP